MKINIENKYHNKNSNKIINKINIITKIGNKNLIIKLEIKFDYKIGNKNWIIKLEIKIGL